MGTTGAQALGKNPNWKGGRTVASSGYVLVKRPGHPMADRRGYVYEHRFVMSEILGRPLARGELVHHRNGDKTDNRPANLLHEPSRHHHMARHARAGNAARRPEEQNVEVHCACGCGRAFTRFDRWGRPRSYISGHNTRGR